MLTPYSLITPIKVKTWYSLQGLCHLLQNSSTNNNNEIDQKPIDGDLGHVIRADHDYIELRVQVKEELEDEELSDPGDLKIVEQVRTTLSYC